MTVLYSLFSAEGVVFAADSVLTVRRKGRTEFVDRREPKIFRVPNVSVGKGDGLLGYFGCAEVGGQRMAPWLRGFFQTWPGGAPGDFADRLWRAVVGEQTVAQRRELLGFHLAAFERVEEYVVPGFWFIRNGEWDGRAYIMLKSGFRADEQLRSRDHAVPIPRLRARLRHVQRVFGMPFWYRNGDLPAFYHVTDRLKEAVYYLKQVRGYQVPRTLEAWEQLAVALVDASCRIAKATYAAGTPTIGGHPRSQRLDWP